MTERQTPRRAAGIEPRPGQEEVDERMLTFIGTPFTLNSGNVPVDSFLNLHEKGRLDLDTPYQRGLVWGKTRQRNLIRSLFSGIPIPAVVLNRRMDANFMEPSYDRERNWAFAVVDGKQRITTVIQFMTGQLGIPAEWFEPTLDKDLVYWDDLGSVTQRRFTNRAFITNYAHLDSLDHERDLFDLLNFGGVAQGDVDEDL